MGASVQALQSSMKIALCITTLTLAYEVGLAYGGALLGFGDGLRHVSGLTPGFGLGDSLDIGLSLPRRQVRQNYATTEAPEADPVAVLKSDQNVDEDIVESPGTNTDPVTIQSTTPSSEPIDPIVDKVIAFLDEFFSSESGAPVTNKTGLQLDDLAPVDSISSDSVVHEVVHAAPIIDSKISPGMSGSVQNTRILKNRVAPVISEFNRSANVLDNRISPVQSGFTHTTSVLNNKSSLRQSGSVRKVRVLKQRISPRLGNSPVAGPNVEHSEGHVVSGVRPVIHSAAVTPHISRGAVYPGESSYTSDVIPFTYQYSVDDEATNSHYNEAVSDDGTGVREGTYNVALPDGRTQHVTYNVDDVEGYIAAVSYVTKYPGDRV